MSVSKPFTMMEGEADDDPPARWQQIASAFTCLMVILLSLVAGVGTLMIIGYLVWLYWPGAA